MITFWLCFVPLFIAVDALGILPIFIGLIEGLERSKVRKIIWQSVVTAMVVALAFLAVGKAIFAFIGITIADFMIAGGALLFVLSLRDILTYERLWRSVDADSLGSVPLGVPLIVGPAVLTTTILLTDAYGIIPTIPAVVLNILFAGVVFWLYEPINRVLGKSGTRTISKLAHIILAAIGVMMVRKGIMIYIVGNIK